LEGRAVRDKERVDSRTRRGRRDSGILIGGLGLDELSSELEYGYDYDWEEESGVANVM
jgi:hypothetical protein